MNYRSLADFLEMVRESGELDCLDREVDPCGEAADIARKTARERGMATFFSALRGYDLPAVANLFGTEQRVCRALGAKHLSELTERVHRTLSVPNAEGLFSKWAGSSQTILLAATAPRKVKSASCQQIVRLGNDVDLFQLPLVQSAVGEKARVLPAAPLISASPDTRQPYAGRHDFEILDRRRLAVCFADSEEPAIWWKEYRRRNEKMPLAIVFGEPTFMLASAAVLPGEMDACSLAGLFRKKPLEVVACNSVDLAVPAEAEMVVEGYLDPQTPPVMAGPMLSPLGELTASRPAPVMHVSAITHRANPVYPAIIYGKPPHEASTIARTLARIFLPAVKAAIEGLTDYDLPEFGAARLWATLSIRKSYAGQAQQVAGAATAIRPFRFAKWLVIVDEEVDVRDQPAVSAAMAANVNPARDISIQPCLDDPYDPAAITSDPNAINQRMVVDATRK